MGGQHYGQKSAQRERQIAALEQQARQDIARVNVGRLPGHVVEVAGMGAFTALEVDAQARVVYCWRESDPDQVWPIPFDRIIMPLVLTRGPMPR